MRLSYHPRFRQELRDAESWYEGQQEGLGHEFVAQASETVAAVKHSPGAHARFRGEIRVALLKRFPYGVYFRIAEDEIRLLTIRHHARHPD